MSNKTPVNPNWGPRSVELVASSLPYGKHGDEDPTIAYFDGEGESKGSGGGRPIIFGGGVTDPMNPDHVRGPIGAPTNGSGGGDVTNNG